MCNMYEQIEIEKLMIPPSVIVHSEMAKIERRFINGIIRTDRPKNLLEVGVSQGARAAVLLDAIADIPSDV